MGNIFFIADEHYGHENVIKFCNRPFSEVEEMNETLITNHNSRVKNGDLVYHSGDMFWRKLGVQKAHEIMDRLNGQHYYIWGNHEELMEANQDLRERFVWCKDLATIFPNGYPKIVLCHYAMRVWRGSQRGSWHLYGHSHGELPDDPGALSFDVGVDPQKYFPISLEEVAAKMEQKRKLRDERIQYLKELEWLNRISLSANSEHCEKEK
jgi:calcineurin-like phosphoesterase family protein